MGAEKKDDPEKLPGYNELKDNKDLNNDEIETKTIKDRAERSDRTVQLTTPWESWYPVKKYQDDAMPEPVSDNKKKPAQKKKKEDLRNNDGGGDFYRRCRQNSSHLWCYYIR